jgi:hypothetical protein
MIGLGSSFSLCPDLSLGLCQLRVCFSGRVMVRARAREGLGLLLRLVLCLWLGLRLGKCYG